jgi:hypothetical protein
VARYNVDGSLDTSFGTGGKTTTPIEALSRGRSVVVQTDGKILVAGSISDGTNLFFAVVRYLGTSATAPDSPTINSITSGDRRVTVSFTAGADNGATITDYEYSLNGGAFISAGITSSSFTITGLNGRSTYSVTIKARNSVGLSGASNSLSATTTNAALDASEAAASEAARAAEAARQKAQQELTEIFTLIPELGKLSQNLSKSSLKLVGKRCVKKGKVKYVPKSTKCPIGYKAKEK